MSTAPALSLIVPVYNVALAINQAQTPPQVYRVFEL